MWPPRVVEETHISWVDVKWGPQSPAAQFLSDVHVTEAHHMSSLTTELGNDGGFFPHTSSTHPSLFSFPALLSSIPLANIQAICATYEEPAKGMKLTAGMKKNLPSFPWVPHA